MAVEVALMHVRSASARAPVVLAGSMVPMRGFSAREVFTKHR